MGYRAVTDDEIEFVRNLNEPAGVIGRKLQALIGELEKMFNGAEPGGVKGVSFIGTEDPRVIATVHTNFGVGRLRLNWASEDNQLVGIVTVERQAYNERDEPVWEPVYGFAMSEQKGWRLIKSQGTPPAYNSLDPKNRYFALGVSILFAIFHGPVVDES